MHTPVYTAILVVDYCTLLLTMQPDIKWYKYIIGVV